MIHVGIFKNDLKKSQFFKFEKIFEFKKKKPYTCSVFQVVYLVFRVSELITYVKTFKIF